MRDAMALVWLVGLFALAIYGQEKSRPFVGAWFVVGWFVAVPVAMIAFAT